MPKFNISDNAERIAQLEIQGLKNVVNMGSQRYAYLEEVIAKGGVEGLSLEDAKQQAEAMKVRLADHKARIAELEKSL